MGRSVCIELVLGTSTIIVVWGGFVSVLRVSFLQQYVYSKYVYINKYYSSSSIIVPNTVATIIARRNYANLLVCDQKN